MTAEINTGTDDLIVPSVFEAMVLVARDIGPVAKNLKNVDAGYAARSIDDVLNAAHEALCTHGVLPVPRVLSASYETVEVGRNRTRMRQATLEVQFSFYGPAGDHVDVVMMGEALDSGDKATNKAASAAFKYALLQTFTIPLVGDDADERQPERSDAPDEPPPVPKITAEQADELAALLLQLGRYPAEWIERGYRDKKTLEYLPAVDFDAARDLVLGELTAPDADTAGTAGDGEAENREDSDGTDAGSTSPSPTSEEEGSVPPAAPSSDSSDDDAGARYEGPQ